MASPWNLKHRRRPERSSWGKSEYQQPFRSACSCSQRVTAPFLSPRPSHSHHRLLSGYSCTFIQYRAESKADCSLETQRTETISDKPKISGDQNLTMINTLIKLISIAHFSNKKVQRALHDQNNINTSSAIMKTSNRHYMLSSAIVKIFNTNCQVKYVKNYS